jgi:probable rRNA maturation factor
MPDGPAYARTASRASARKELAVSIVDERGRPLAARGLAAWLQRVAPARARGVVTVAVVSDRRVRALNRTYRRKDYATDVLSFPNPQSPVPSPCLGDIVIARGVARRQARDARHSEQTELRLLALHGLLHLIGYDHERDDGRMLRIERRLRRKGGLAQGLLARARPSAFAEATADRRSAKRGGWSTGSGRARTSRHARGELVEPRAAR